MASRFYIGPNGGLWSTTANWSNVSGGAGGFSVPGSGDSAVIDENSNNCNMDGDFTVDTLYISEYALTLGGSLTARWIMIGYHGDATVQLHGKLIAGAHTITASERFWDSSNGFVRGTSTVVTNGNCNLASGFVNPSGGEESFGQLNFYNLHLSGTTTLTAAGSNNMVVGVWGDLIASGDITNGFDVNENALFRVYGTQSNVTANARNLDSFGGKRIYTSGSITNSPFWRSAARTTVHITSAVELQAMSDDTNDNYVLDNDIDLTGVDWVPVGTLEDPFTGEFDGGGFTISNLSNTAGNTENAGLFGYVGSALSYKVLYDLGSSLQETLPPGGYEQASIHDLDLSDVDINGEFKVAALCGVVWCADIDTVTVSNVTITMNSGDDRIGGFIGQCYGQEDIATTISNCSISNVTITGANSEVGGLVGYILGLGPTRNIGDVVISSCFSTDVTINGLTGDTGGLLGSVDGLTCEDCYSESALILSEAGGSDFGGFAGNTFVCSLLNCYSTVDISTASLIEDFYNIGGFIGRIREGGIFSKCYSEGDITLIGASGGYADIGGFVGYAESNISNCYARVNITALSYQEVGGFMGANNTIEIANCYATGTITADDSVGGFIGGDYGGLRQNCYSVGVVTGNSATGGFIGKNDDVLNLDNCSWYTGAATNAIGDDGASSPVAVLSGAGYGTDESDNTAFYTIDHDVYIQGDPDEWDFTTPIWYERDECTDYPTFEPCSGEDIPSTIDSECGVVGVVTSTINNLSHLEGQTVAILADGEVLPQQVVLNGTITLEDSYAKVHVGLPIVSDFETLNVELPLPDGTLQGRKVKIGNVTFRLVDSRGGWVGPNEDRIYESFPNAIINKLGGENLALLYTGDIRVPLGAGYESGGRVFYRQVDPLPITIGAVVPELAAGGASG